MGKGDFQGNSGLVEVEFVVGYFPRVDQCVSVKNDEIVSGLEFGLWEVFSKLETLEVEFEALLCPGNFGFLADLSFREIVT